MTTSTNLRSVAAEFALTWPSMYLRLGDDGMPDESTHDTPQHVPLLYFSTDVELLSAEEIGRRLAMLAEPDDFRHIDPAEGLLPFGMEPGGNLYCFHTGAADGDRVPVVLLQNDGPEDERLAPDLSGFVFGEMLRTATEFYEDDYLGEGDPKQNAATWLRTHEPYLEPGQVTVLRDVFGWPLVHRDDDSMAFLEPSDAEHLIDTVLEYPERHEPLRLWERG